MYDILESAKSSNHAQRNWSDEPVLSEDVNLLIEVARSMPTKQNICTYELIASTNKTLNKFIYLNSYNPDQDDQDEYNSGLAWDHGGQFYRNSQVNAPLLFIYLIYENPNNIGKYTEKDVNQYYLGTGISSGAVALAANMKGYKTGFCSCVIADNVLKELKNNYNISIDFDNNFIDVLLLGIGNPNKNLKHNQIVNDDGEVFEVSSYPKNIKHIIINE